MIFLGACLALGLAAGNGPCTGDPHPGPPVFLELHLTADGLGAVLNGEQTVLFEWLGIEGPFEAPFSEEQRAVVWSAARTVLRDLMALEADGQRVPPRVHSVEALGPHQGAYGAELSLIIAVDYGLLRPPQEVALEWSLFPEDTLGGEPRLPVHLLGDNFFDYVVLTSAEPRWTWHRDQSDSFSLPPLPPPVVHRRSVQRSLTLLILSLAAGWSASCFANRRGRALSIGLGGLLLAWSHCEVGRGALILPDEGQSLAIHSALMRRVYAAFDCTTEESTYRLLAASVEPQLLDALYQGIRSSLVQSEEGGGARGRVESLEILDARSKPRASFSGRAAFEVQAEWVVGGRVVHFGHEHARRVRYQGLLTIVAGESPGGGSTSWVLAGLDVRSQVREPVVQ